MFFGVPFRYASYISEVDKGLVETKVWRQQINRMVKEWTNFNILVSRTSALLYTFIEFVVDPSLDWSLRKFFHL